jgi:hypothetical protein
VRILPSFAKAVEWTSELMRTSAYEVRGTRWQSTDVSTKPEMRMKEILNHSFQVKLGNEDIPALQRDIMPNLPWAEDHFLERVGGKPLNPGVQWRNWPWALSADKFRTEGEAFSHTYMERYWPKRAGQMLTGDDLPHLGIRYRYGDLNDVIDHLLGDPLTRQAYFPVWFPEDTGVVHGERVPCSLGYHWILRNGYLHTSYFIRSCDFVRHFRDDLYLSTRLTYWLLDQLRKKQEELGLLAVNAGPGYWIDWKSVQLGLFTFHCVSMHCFVNDWNTMYARVAV